MPSEALHATFGGMAVGAVVIYFVANGFMCGSVNGPVLCGVGQGGVQLIGKGVEVLDDAAEAVFGSEGEALSEGGGYVEKECWAIEEQEVEGDGRPVADEDVGCEQDLFGIRVLAGGQDTHAGVLGYVVGGIQVGTYHNGRIVVFGDS